MAVALIIPIFAQLLSLGLKLAVIIEQSKAISAEDKGALKALIKEARDGVTYIDENTEEGS